VEVVAKDNMDVAKVEKLQISPETIKIN